MISFRRGKKGEKKEKKREFSSVFLYCKTLENFKGMCKNSASDIASKPRSVLLLPLKEMREVLPAAVTVLCLAECKEQAENYRQGEVPGCYNANPC